jgi:nucleoside-diphosphate-sugar epimerase
VVEYLFQQGEISKGIFRKGAHLKIMDANAVQGVESDLLDHHTLHEAMEGVDTIYSMASPMPYGDEDFEVNTEGVHNLLEVAREMRVKTIVHLSALDVYGFKSPVITNATVPLPSGDYQKSKLEADRIVQEFGRDNTQTRVVIIRAARAVGSRDPTFVIPLLRMIESGKVSLPGAGSMSFSHPKDIAQAMYKAATNPSLAGKVYLVKSFDASTEELGRAVVTALSSSAAVKKEGIFAKSSLPRYTADQLRASLRIDEKEGWSELGYSPQYGLQQTCDEIVQWYRKEPWVTEAQ